MQSDVIQRRVSNDFFEALQRYDMGEIRRLAPLAAIPTSACCHWRSREPLAPNRKRSRP